MHGVVVAVKKYLPSPNGYRVERQHKYACEFNAQTAPSHEQAVILIAWVMYRYCVDPHLLYFRQTKAQWDRKVAVLAKDTQITRDGVICYLQREQVWAILESKALNSVGLIGDTQHVASR